MNLHEYQGKELLSSYGIPVQRGKIASTVEEAVAGYEQLKAEPGKDISKNATITEQVSKIDDLISQIDEKQKEYDLFKAETEQKRTETPETDTATEVEVEVTPVTPKKPTAAKSTKKSDKNEKAE